MAAHLSEALDKITENDTRRIAILLGVAKLSPVPSKFALEKWIGHMSHDEKVSNSVMCFVGLNRLDEADITEIADMEILRQTLQLYLQQCRVQTETA